MKLKRKKTEKKNETVGIAIEEYVRLRPKIYSFLVDNNEYKKANDLNKNAIAAIDHNECKYKDVLLKNKCWMNSINRIQSNDHRIGTYEIKKTFIVLL